jgi:hypothetical protein
MPETLNRRLPVATCIACGARSRGGECESGCVDVPLDLVDAGDVDALAARLEALEARRPALREVVEELAAGALSGWPAVRAQARAALGVPVPEAGAGAEIVEAWGCPQCGRVDAPQPCLGVCIRRPVLMADASEYRALADRVEPATQADRELSALARLAAHVNPRPGQEDRTRGALASRARALLPVPAD